MKLNAFKCFLLVITLFTSTLTFGSNNIGDDKENTPPLSNQAYASGSSEDENGWRTRHTKGYEGYYNSAESDENTSQYSYDDADNYTTSDSDSTIEYEAWNVEKLNDMLSLEFEAFDDFTPESIRPPAIKKFLENYVEPLNGTDSSGSPMMKLASQKFLY